MSSTWPFGDALRAAGTLSGRLVRPDTWLGAPAGMVQTIFTVARQRLVGRRLTVRSGDTEVTLTPTELTATSQPLGLVVGQFRDVRLAARDVVWDGRRLERVAVDCHNVHLRPGATSLTLVTAPVDVEVLIAAADLAAWAGSRWSWLSLWAGEGAHASVGLTSFPGLGSLEFTPRLEGRVVRLAPRSVTVRGRRIPLTRLPAPSVPLTGLPEGVDVLGIEPADSGIVVRARVAQWRGRLTPGQLADLLRAVGQASARLVLPRIDHVSEESDVDEPDADPAATAPADGDPPGATATAGDPG